jgi:Asp-tRNA(Asn)/Glu-tRNA(Gln) amidotransferase A subunit family amidase
VEPHQLSVTELGLAFRSLELSPVEAVADVLTRIEAVNPGVNAFVTITDDLALDSARSAEKGFLRREPESLSPLTGVPVTIKDLLPTEGIRTTFGSYAFEDHVPHADVAVVRRLRENGVAILGKTTTPEFGWKCPTDSPLLGITRNPWAPDRTPGGSTGGSAVAVASGLGPVGVGSDGGGSIRQPASFCGILGFKPSFGRIPCAPPSGAIDVFNTIGLVARTTADVALVLDVVAGADEEDWYSLPAQDVRYTRELAQGIAGTRVAWTPDLGFAAVEPEVAAIAEAAAERFQELGCHVVEAHPHWEDPAEWFEDLCMRMMAASLREYRDRLGDRMDPDLAAAIEDSRALTIDALVSAGKRRIEFQAVAAEFFDSFDLLLTPTMAVEPFEVGLKQPRSIAGRTVQWMQWTPFTYPINIIGSPAASVPAGWTRQGLPVGLQIVGGLRQDSLVLRACQSFETLQPWHSRWPERQSSEDRKER